MAVDRSSAREPAAPSPPSVAPPPAIQRNVRRPLTLLGCGIVAAALLLLVLFNIDHQTEPPPAPALLSDITELVAPAPLEPGQLEESAQRESIEQAIGEMPAGGWIQITGEDGRLAQQYRFRRLDPDPPGMGTGWIQLTEPEFEIYGAGGSVVVLRGDSALALRSDKAVKSGTLTGNVVILRYEDVGDTELDRTLHEPTLVVTTDEASFDNILGELRSDGVIRIELPRGEFTGRGLTLLLNDQEGIIQHVTVEEVHEIRLASPPPGAGATPGAAVARAPTPPAPERVSDPAPERKPDSRPAKKRKKDKGERKQKRGTKDGTPKDETRKAAAPGTDATFYRLTLNDDVRIVQGQGDAARWATANTLALVFSTESEGLGAVLAFAPGPDHRPTGPPAPPRRLADLLVASVLATPGDEDLDTPPEGLTPASNAAPSMPPPSIAPPRRPEDTIITCTGGLTMVPVLSAHERLDSAQDARLELLGNPVRLEDPAAEAHATCASVRYHVRAGELELLGSGTHPLTVTSPELTARSDRFWLAQARQVGGFSGPGEIGLRRGDDDQAQARITWTERADLAFEATEAGNDGELGVLRQATFAGDVLVRGADLPVTPQTDPTRDLARGALRTEQLQVDFGRRDETDDGDGRPALALEHLRATGDVEARDDTQVLRAQSLDAWFAATSAEAASADESAPAGDLDRLVAETDVRLQLADGQRVYADRLDVDATGRLAILSGGDVRLLDGQNLIDRAEVVTIDDRVKHYVLAGRGRFRRFDQPLQPPADRNGLILFGDLEGNHEELRVTWKDGLEVFAGGAEQTGQARFSGEVNVLSPELKLTHADEMIVTFATDPTEDDAGTGSALIESIAAHGSVRARSVGEPGELQADHLHVSIRPDPGGSAVPERLLAVGNVHLADADQSMWTERLTVGFHDRAVENGAASADGEFSGARVAIGEVRAEGGVQLRLPDGARVFADRLVGDGTNETAELHGERVLVVSDEFVLDHGTHVLVDRRQGRYEVRGPGAFAQLAEPIALVGDDDTPITPPEIDGERTLEAAWTESAVYTGGEDTAGTLTLRGGVHAESNPGPLERNAIDGDVVALDFETRTAADGSTANELVRLVAEGEARLENRIWADPDGAGQPRVFYVAGPRVDYDQRSLEARVTGAGELLIRDETTDGADPAPGDTGGDPIGFTGKGTTLFRWNDELRMTQEVDEVFRIALRGDVECLHRGIDERALSFTGQQLDATVARAGAEREQQEEGEPGVLKFGGPMEARRLTGRGSVYIRTPERDVACDFFDYNLVTGLAEIGADRGRMVSVLNRGANAPLRHERILWDMANDTITIYRGSGSGAP